MLNTYSFIMIYYLKHTNQLWNIIKLKLWRCFNKKKFLSSLFKENIGREMNWNYPTSFNEKLNWLKIKDHNPLYTQLVDKYKVKDYVAERIGEEYVIPTIGIYEKFEDIDFEKLPEKFVMKTTHDSGTVVICRNKKNLNFEQIKKKLIASMTSDYYKNFLEWPYKDVKHRIIIERLIETNEDDLRDYKFFCFNGVCQFMYVASNRFGDNGEVCFDFYDKDFNHLPIVNQHPNSKTKIPKPDLFEEMKVLVEKLSKGLKHVRVDLYEAKHRIYFGEFTFYHMAGLSKFEPQEWDFKFGQYLNLK